MEQEEAETNLQILLDFLQCLKKRKLDELNEIQSDLHYIKEDIHAVERHRIDLYRAREQYYAKLRILADVPNLKNSWPSLIDKHSGAIVSSAPGAQGLCHMSSGTSENSKIDAKTTASHLILRKNASGGSDAQNITQSSLVMAKKMRVHAQFNDLRDYYLQKRRYWVSQEQQQRDSHGLNRESCSASPEDFQSVLSTFTRYSWLQVVAELRHGVIFHSANIVSRYVEFSECCADFSQVPLFKREQKFGPELSEHLRDYEGIVTVWDVTTRQSVIEYEEHEKGAWSVDFSHTEPQRLYLVAMIATCLNFDCIILEIITFIILTLEILASRCIFSEHRKTVSYVKFLSNNELASASTDNTLRLWDVKENVPAISKPVACHRFSSDTDEADEDAGSSFISSLCWKSDSLTMLTANSQGTIKVLALAP